jgi:hypothetical protein
MVRMYAYALFVFFSMCLFSYIYVTYFHVNLYLPYENKMCYDQYDLITHKRTNDASCESSNSIPFLIKGMFELYIFTRSTGALLFFIFFIVGCLVVIIKRKKIKLFHLSLILTLMFMIFILMRLLIV